MNPNTFLYDTEFLELGPTQPISLISIGVVHPASGKEYYAVSGDLPEAQIKRKPWLMENVWPYLPTTLLAEGHGPNADSRRRCRCTTGHLDKSSPLVKPREQIATELAMFVSTLGSPNRDENDLWAYYCSYDHVVLAQLWGTMMDLPECMPMFTHDLKVEAVRQGFTELPVQDTNHHNALHDARWNVAVGRVLGIC